MWGCTCDALCTPLAQGNIPAWVTSMPWYVRDQWYVRALCTLYGVLHPFPEQWPGPMLMMSLINGSMDSGLQPLCIWHLKLIFYRYQPYICWYTSAVCPVLVGPELATAGVRGWGPGTDPFVCSTLPRHTAAQHLEVSGAVHQW
jgi:hypothetical protein